MKRAVVLLNGVAPSQSLLETIKPDDYIVCADGAYEYIKGKFIPDVLIGDYDSLGYEPSEDCAKKIIKFPVEKDYTDGTLALKIAMESGVKQVLILGAFGGRSDHFYVNLTLLYQASQKDINAIIFGENERISLIEGKIEETVEINDIVSLVPFFECSHIISTKGLKYPANGITLDKGHADYGISNVATAKEIIVEVEGKTLMFITRSEE